MLNFSKTKADDWLLSVIIIASSYVGGILLIFVLEALGVLNCNCRTEPLAILIVPIGGIALVIFSRTTSGWTNRCKPAAWMVVALGAGALAAAPVMLLVTNHESFGLGWWFTAHMSELVASIIVALVAVVGIEGHISKKS